MLSGIAVQHADNGYSIRWNSGSSLVHVFNLFSRWHDYGTKGGEDERVGVEMCKIVFLRALPIHLFLHLWFKLCLTTLSNINLCMHVCMYVLVQTLLFYDVLFRHNSQRHWQTDGRTDRQHYHANSRSCSPKRVNDSLWMHRHAFSVSVSLCTVHKCDIVECRQIVLYNVAFL